MEDESAKVPNGDYSNHVDTVVGRNIASQTERRKFAELAAKYHLASASSYNTTVRDEPVMLRIGETEHNNQRPITVMQFFLRTVEKFPSRVAMRVKRDGGWQEYTYSRYYGLVRKTAKSLIKLGLERFHGVGIIGFNSPEWLLSDLGTIFAGGFAVGVYTTNSPEACAYVLENCEANITIVENQKQLDKILKVWPQLPHLKAVIQYTGTPAEKHPNVYTWEEFLELSNDVPDEDLEERMTCQRANMCCTLIYTSGTTGNPKGVMLSHDNLTWVTDRVWYFISPLVNDRTVEHCVSYLPLSHIAAQLTDIFIPIILGASVSFAQPDALKGSLVETFREVKPTLILGVPRVYEKIMEKMLAVGSTITGVKRRIADWAKKVALEGNMNLEKGESTPFGWTLANALILKKIRVVLGLEHCKLQVVGAAPVTLETLRYFQSVNLPLCELYGMSETTGPQTVSINPNKVRTGSCGVLVDGFEMKLADRDEDGSGEICMQGRHVFMGYLNNKEKTEEALDEDGWLHSGDVGKIDQDGFLYITGRIKELIITAGGENIPPVPIEDRVKAECPLISNIMVIGDKKKFLSCLVTLKSEVDPETGEPQDDLMKQAVNYCQSLGSPSKTVSGIISTKDRPVYQAIQSAIDKYNKHATSNAQKIQKFIILEQDFSIPGGELGPTMKLKRPHVVKKYQSKIDSLYS